MTAQTAFVLVSECFTGGWIWREVAARLRQAGAEVHPVTLTGMGDRRHLAGPGTDLETHVEDVVQLIDHVDAAELVVVGHGYGIHPVLGAADRRPERVARIVHLDAGAPQDGDVPLALVPDPEVHALLASGEEGRIPPPASAEAWERWGSTAGVSAGDLDRLVRLAAPQPAGTLTRPLPLTGAAAGLPSTGVFCTGNGLSIALVQSLVESGPPQFRALAVPEKSFFDLETGHWPMLSVPDEVVGVLLRAAGGEGHRLTAPAGDEHPYLRPFPFDVQECPRARIGRVDLHLPQADGPRPAVIFLHGGPIPADLRPTPRDWPLYTGYARYVASLGAVGVTVDHGLHALGDYPRAADDIAEAVELVRADPRVDPDRIALWYFSGAGLLTTDWLAAPPPWLRCLAATYPVLAPLTTWPGVDPRFRPSAAVRTAGDLPIVLTRVGLEIPEIAATVEDFVAAANATNANLHVIDAPNAHHGFETVDLTPESRTAVTAAVDAVLSHVKG
ncbi:alpha/beta hydrolase [Streptomyces purpureus]|uniref:alpha/beta hydrolase n=1 Tax=Streptomyces purpureus TaxID=1951 RepID=UPI0003603269|nr:alpha/beta hydrolase [Streptomyces purpureus]